jgi:RNA recognition motif-containing protein
MGKKNYFPEATVFLCNIPFDMQEADILDLFPHRSSILRSDFPRGSNGRF